jgi:hypothetical protein
MVRVRLDRQHVAEELPLLPKRMFQIGNVYAQLPLPLLFRKLGSQLANLLGEQRLPLAHVLNVNRDTVNSVIQPRKFTGERLSQRRLERVRVRRFVENGRIKASINECKGGFLITDAEYQDADGTNDVVPIGVFPNY